QGADLRLESQRARTFDRSEAERLLRAESVGPPLSRPGEVDRAPELIEDVKRRRRGGRVRPDRDGNAGGAELRDRRDAAAEHGVRPGAVGDADAVLRKQRDLLL